MPRGSARCAATWRPGFELDIITIVLLGGVSIFGGSGNMLGVGLSILVILNLRNGMGLGQHHRQHPDGRDRRAADPVGACSEPDADNKQNSSKGERHEEVSSGWRRAGAGDD